MYMLAVSIEVDDEKQFFACSLLAYIVAVQKKPVCIVKWLVWIIWIIKYHTQRKDHT